MSELNISEAGSVQFPMVAHTAAIGWTPIPPEVAKQKRGREAGMLFRGELEAVLARFNPCLWADAVRQLIHTGGGSLRTRARVPGLRHRP